MTTRKPSPSYIVVAWIETQERFVGTYGADPFERHLHSEDLLRPIQHGQLVSGVVRNGIT